MSSDEMLDITAVFFFNFIYTAVAAAVVVVVVVLAVVAAVAREPRCRPRSTQAHE